MSQTPHLISISRWSPRILLFTQKIPPRPGFLSIAFFIVFQVLYSAFSRFFFVSPPPLPKWFLVSGFSFPKVIFFRPSPPKDLRFFGLDSFDPPTSVSCMRPWPWSTVFTLFSGSGILPRWGFWVPLCFSSRDSRRNHTVTSRSQEWLIQPFFFFPLFWAFSLSLMLRFSAVRGVSFVNASVFPLQDGQPRHHPPPPG